MGAELGQRQYLSNDGYLNLALAYGWNGNGIWFNSAMARCEYVVDLQKADFGAGVALGAWWSGELMFEYPSLQAGFYIEPGIHFEFHGKRDHHHFILGMYLAMNRMPTWRQAEAGNNNRRDWQAYVYPGLRLGYRFGYRHWRGFW